MRASWICSACGLTALVIGLGISGCSGKSNTPRSEPEVAYVPPPIPAPVDEAPTFEPAAPIHFEYNEHTITPDAGVVLQDVAVAMKANPEWSLVLEGHCDERGTTQYNAALGESRAEAAKSYLVSLGIEEARVATVSFGEARPLDAGAGEASWARNRRAEFRPRPPQS